MCNVEKYTNICGAKCMNICQCVHYDHNLLQPSTMSPYCPLQTLTTNTITFSNVSSLSLQITATRHAIKTDCGVGVTAVGYTCCCILVMVGDPACKSGNTVS